MSLETDVKLLTDITNDLDENAARGAYDSLDTALICLAAIREARTQLAHVEHELENRLAPVMDKRVVIPGVGTFEKHAKKNRTQWDRDDLLRAVLDTRIVDKDTGEVLDETPLQKVLQVWNLGAPRVTALRQRGLDADEFCRSEPAGFSIQLIN